MTPIIINILIAGVFFIVGPAELGFAFLAGVAGGGAMFYAIENKY